MSLDVIFSEEAETQFTELVDWWTVNRPDASIMLEDKLARVLDLLVDQPGIGLLYKRKTRYPVRRHPLNETPYYVFYSVVPENNELHVLAVWSMVQKRRPPLRLL